METTYRLTSLFDRTLVGQTAATPELAKLAPGDLSRADRLGLEQTDWEDTGGGRMRGRRTILIAAEDTPGEWDLGV